MPNLYLLLTTFTYITAIYAQGHIRENPVIDIVGQPQFSKEISAEERFLQQDNEEVPQVSNTDPQEVQVSYDNKEEHAEQGQTTPEAYPVVTPEVYPIVTPRTEDSEGYPEENQEKTEIDEEHTEFHENSEGENEFESEIDEERREEAQAVLTVFGEDPESEEPEQSGGESLRFLLNGPAR